MAGDAGHVHVPIGGQGMNKGIQDAFNLGWKLAGVATGALQNSVLDSYHLERHPVAEGLIKGTHFAYTGILAPSQARQYAAGLFGPFLLHNEAVQNFVRNTLVELTVFYPTSPLNLDLRGAKGPKPGERVLDATLVRASDKATVTINELTRATSWTLLLFTGVGVDASIIMVEELSAGITKRFGSNIKPYIVIADKSAHPHSLSADQVLLDTLHYAHERYGVTSPSFYLLRPDTYVGARGPIVEGSKLIGHLDAIFSDAATSL